MLVILHPSVSNIPLEQSTSSFSGRERSTTVTLINKLIINTRIKIAYVKRALLRQTPQYRYNQRYLLFLFLFKKGCPVNSDYLRNKSIVCHTL